MDQKNFSKPLSLAKVQVTDAFWKKEMELVRTEVIPYQWNALNDNVPGARPSFCMRNYRRAGEVVLCGVHGFPEDAGRGLVQPDESRLHMSASFWAAAANFPWKTLAKPRCVAIMGSGPQNAKERSVGTWRFTI